MSAQALDYVILAGLGIILAVLGYNLMVQGRNILQPEARVKSASQMIYAGLGVLIIGAVVGLIALLLVILKR
jgi:uncharacterized membrane protein YidH (DUF202 family)